LYNGALGTIIDIIFREGENLNDGDLLLVVVVEFKHYRGPIWDKKHPTHVSLVPIKKRCEPSYCTWYSENIPLHIAWAKTIHSIGRHNAGPNPANQTPNAIQIIIIHLGEITYEALNHGLTYMAI
jgi:hypothetical protein